MSPHWHRTREALALTFIERYRDMYERSHNVKHAYSAYHAARKAGVRPPDWVQAVIDEAAETVHTAPEDATANDLARTLGIGGPPGHTIGGMAATDLKHEEIRTYVSLRAERHRLHREVVRFVRSRVKHHRGRGTAAPSRTAIEEAAERFKGKLVVPFPRENWLTRSIDRVNEIWRAPAAAAPPVEEAQHEAAERFGLTYNTIRDIWHEKRTK